MRRRSFLAAPVIAGAVPAFCPAPLAAAGNQPVSMMGDGIPHSPAEHASLLQELAASVEPDSYSIGGTVKTLEERFAAALGKETAVWLPTGTLANHLAVRILAGDKRRVLVQHESHLYNDCGDCCQTLSALHLVPLAPGKATFTLEEVEAAAARGASGRVAVPIGAIQIETPVRRKDGEQFDLGEMKRISTWARERSIGLHLDGARLFLASAYSGIAVRDYAALFDTVYVSLYKYFNAPSGAVLAGPRRLLENLFHLRRMFGGGLPHVWPFAATALHYFDGFEERYRRAVQTAEAALAALKTDPRFEIQPIPNGTNIFVLRVRGVDPQAFRKRLEQARVAALPPAGDRFALQVNETWNRATPEEIVARFRGALA